jgi:hypothetical protein
MDTIKKRILPVRQGTIACNQTDNRRWAVVDLWNSTSHLESSL